MTASGDATLESVGWICVRDRRLLVARTRGRDAFYLPGGKVEPGEDGHQALVREVREELGLALEPTSLREELVVEDMAHGLSGTRVRMRCFSGHAPGEPTPSREIAELAYVTATDAGRCAPAATQVLRRLAAAGLIEPSRDTRV